MTISSKSGRVTRTIGQLLVGALVGALVPVGWAAVTVVTTWVQMPQYVVSTALWIALIAGAAVPVCALAGLLMAAGVVLAERAIALLSRRKLTAHVPVTAARWSGALVALPMSWLLLRLFERGFLGEATSLSLQGALVIFAGVLLGLLAGGSLRDRLNRWRVRGDVCSDGSGRAALVDAGLLRPVPAAALRS